MQTPSMHADATAAIIDANRLASEGRSNMVRSEVALVRADVAISQQQINATWYDAAAAITAANHRIDTTNTKIDELHTKIEGLLRLVQQMMGTTDSASTSMEHTRDPGSGCARAR